MPGEKQGTVTLGPGFWDNWIKGTAWAPNPALTVTKQSFL